MSDSGAFDRGPSGGSLDQDQDQQQTQKVGQQTMVQSMYEPAPPSRKIGHESLIQRMIQRDAIGGMPGPAAAAGAVQLASQDTTGAALANDVRGPVEQITGGDLGSARVHSGPQSAAAAEQIQARAFTHGSDIYLGAGESAADRSLMSHEATHVVQQAGGAGGAQAKSIDVSTPGDAGELEADQVSAAVTSGDLSPRSVTPAGGAARLARTPVNHTTTPTGAPPPLPADSVAPPSGEAQTDSEGNRIVQANGHWYLDEAPHSPAFPHAGGNFHLYPINPNASYAALRAAVVAAQAEQLAFSRSLRGDMKYWFCKVYYYVTTNELAAIDAGTYQYPHMKLQEVMAFHATYKSNLENWRAGNVGRVEAQWREAFSAAEDSESWHRTRSIEIMHALLPSMQAHIRFDLPRALASCYVTHYAGIPGTSMEDFHPDFNAMGPVFDQATDNLLPEIKEETGVMDPGHYGTLQDLGFPFIFNVPMERQHTWEKADHLGQAMENGVSNAGYNRGMRAMTNTAHPNSGSDDFEVDGTDVGNEMDWMHQPGAHADAAGPGASFGAAPAPPAFPARLYFKMAHPHGSSERLEQAIRDDQDLAPYQALAQWTREVRQAQLSVEGHASEEGDDAYNQALSERRTSLLQFFMTQCGMDAVANTLTASSLGRAGAAAAPEWRYVEIVVHNNGMARQQHDTPNANLPSEVNRRR